MTDVQLGMLIDTIKAVGVGVGLMVFAPLMLIALTLREALKAERRME